MPTDHKPLPFLFARRLSDAEPVKGADLPAEPKKWVVSVYPGDVHGMGRTKPEAMQSAYALVERALSRADAKGLSPFAWWHAEFSRMPTPQRDQFTLVMGKLLTHGDFEPFCLQVRMTTTEKPHAAPARNKPAQQPKPHKKVAGLQFVLPANDRSNLFAQCA